MFLDHMIRKQSIEICYKYYCHPLPGGFFVRGTNMWYCAYCGRYHTRLTPAYGFDGWKRSGKIKARDSLCMKGLFYTVLLKDFLGRK
jgi:hypothetical protein